MIKKALLLNFMCVKHAYGEKAARMTWLYVGKELQVSLSYMFHVTSRRVRSVRMGAYMGTILKKGYLTNIPRYE